MTSMVASFVARRWRVPAESVRVKLEPILGGLESTVSRAEARIESRARGTLSFIVKQLPPGGEREADVYDLLWRHIGRPPAARMLGRDVSAAHTYLYLEDVESPRAWPWADTGVAAEVCRSLAYLHESAQGLGRSMTWNYDADLAASAHATLALAAEACDHGGRRFWRGIGELERVVAALPRIRERLFQAGTAVIHGDVHPGNVIVRQTGRRREVVLIDWGRARVGSPLEDVAAWLHSLGCWEPEARRRHDTLMRCYLEARSVPRAFTRDVRYDYWLASASNGLSGAIRYHLAVLKDPASTPAARADSAHALGAWRRVVRRAAALLSTSRRN